jgi:hypothetical protein
VTDVRHFRFFALLTLDPSAGDEPLRQYASGSHDLMVHCSRLDEPAVRQLFPASIYPDDEQPLKPGDSGVLATIVVVGDDACAFLGPGQHIALWNGHDCGHGVISRREVAIWG